MITVKLTNYERNDLVRILDYALENYRKDYKKKKINDYMYQYCSDKVSVLKRRINGQTTIEEILLQKNTDTIERMDWKDDDDV